jgi:hypothetical protein
MSSTGGGFFGLPPLFGFREGMRDQGLMNSLKVLSKETGILSYAGMYQDLVVH